MSAHRSIAQVLAELGAQMAHHESRQAYHAEQEASHREQRERHALELERVRERYERFRAAAVSAEEEIGRRVAEPAAEPLRRTTASKLIARVVESRPEGETFGPSTLAEEINRTSAKLLRRPLDARAVSNALRRLRAEGRIRLVREGRAFHEALYARGRK